MQINEALGSWYEPFKEYLSTNDLQEIYKQLRAIREKGRRIAPSRSDDVFRCFRETPYDKLRVVLAGMCPYHTFTEDGESIADGLCMGCSRTVKTKGLQPTLKLWYDSIEKEYDTKWNKNSNDYGKMEMYARQGILCYNVALTTEEGKPMSHEGIWSKFNKAFWDIIETKTRGIICIFLGEAPQKSMKYLTPMRHYLIPVSHPASSAHQGLDHWDNQGMFRKMEKILWDNNKEHIVLIDDFPF